MFAIVTKNGFVILPAYRKCWDLAGAEAYIGEQNLIGANIIPVLYADALEEEELRELEDWYFRDTRSKS